MSLAARCMEVVAWDTEGTFARSVHMSSPRRRGPITTVTGYCDEPLLFCMHQKTQRMGPRLRGDDRAAKAISC